MRGSHLSTTVVTPLLLHMHPIDTSFLVEDQITFSWPPHSQVYFLHFIVTIVSFLCPNIETNTFLFEISTREISPTWFSDIKFDGLSVHHTHRAD